MEILTKEILKNLSNKHTKVELREDFKGNYYNYILDTIYIAKKVNQQKLSNKHKNINKKAANLVMICHECLHSIQNKWMHILNTILSNLSIVFTIIYVILAIFFKDILILKILTIGIILTSISVRLILEIGAINGSTELASNIVAQGITNEVSNEDIEDAVRYIEKHKYVALLNMILDKIIFLIVAICIK